MGHNEAFLRTTEITRRVRQGNCFDCGDVMSLGPLSWGTHLHPSQCLSSQGTTALEAEVAAKREQAPKGTESCTSRWLTCPWEEGRNWINTMTVKKDKKMSSPARQRRQLALICHINSCPNSTHRVEQNQES